MIYRAVSELEYVQLGHFSLVRVFLIVPFVQAQEVALRPQIGEVLLLDGTGARVRDDRQLLQVLDLQWNLHALGVESDHRRHDVLLRLRLLQVLVPWHVQPVLQVLYDAAARLGEPRVAREANGLVDFCILQVPGNSLDGMSGRGGVHGCVRLDVGLAVGGLVVLAFRIGDRVVRIPPIERALGPVLLEQVELLVPLVREEGDAPLLLQRALLYIKFDALHFKYF